MIGLAAVPAFFTAFLVDFFSGLFFLGLWAMIRVLPMLDSRWGMGTGSASDGSPRHLVLRIGGPRPPGASPKLGAFGAQNDPPDRFDRLRRSRLTHKKAWPRHPVGGRGLCLIHRIRPE